MLIIFYGFGRCNPDNNGIKISDFTDYFGHSLLNITACMDQVTSIPPLHFIVDGFNKEIRNINQSIILSRFDLDNVDFIINFSLIVLYTILIRILAYVILKTKSITK